MMYASERLPPWVFTGRPPSGQRMLPSRDERPALADLAEAVVLELHDHHRREVVVEQRDVDGVGPDARHLVEPLRDRPVPGRRELVVGHAHPRDRLAPAAVPAVGGRHHVHRRVAQVARPLGLVVTTATAPSHSRQKS